MVTVRNLHAIIRRALSNFVGFVAPVAIGNLSPGSAYGASLTGPITGWSKGDVPNTVSMYEYIPASVAANPPILVVLHYCGGTAAEMFTWGNDIVSAADQYGFVIVYPQTSNGCWDVSSTETQTRFSNSDSHAIIEMVDDALKKHGGNVNRVYAAGISSGAMMTELLLALYPDVFKAGSEFSGVPAGCGNVFDSLGWCGDATAPTAQQWGDRVRAMVPGYTGYRPRIQLWHGTADSTINYQNQLEAIKEWTNVLGLSVNPTTPSTTVTIAGHSWNHESWQDRCGYTVLDVWSEPGGPHNTDAPLNGSYVIPFLSLDNPGSTDPKAHPCDDGGASRYSPYSGSPAAMPGKIQVEDFDNGDEGIAYHDTDTMNIGSTYRTTGVDVEPTSDAGGGYDVGWTEAGEWLSYAVNVASAGRYTLQLRVASNGDGGTFHIEFNGMNATGTLTVPNTGDWQTYQTLTVSVNLSVGTQVIRLVMDGTGSGGYVGNFNWLNVSTESTGFDGSTGSGGTSVGGTGSDGGTGANGIGGAFGSGGSSKSITVNDSSSVDSATIADASNGWDCALGGANSKQRDTTAVALCLALAALVRRRCSSTVPIRGGTARRPVDFRNKSER